RGAVVERAVVSAPYADGREARRFVQRARADVTGAHLEPQRRAAALPSDAGSLIEEQPAEALPAVRRGHREIQEPQLVDAPAPGGIAHERLVGALREGAAHGRVVVRALLAELRLRPGKWLAGALEAHDGGQVRRRER